MNRKQLFIDWISADKLKKVTPNDLADLMERVFQNHFNISIWSICSPEKYNELRNVLHNSKEFKRNDKKSYKIFILNSKFYELFLKQNEKLNPSEDEFKIADTRQDDLASKTIGKNDKDFSNIYDFFEDDYFSEFFYQLFSYSKKQNPELKLDIRSSIIGVNKDPEILRFYSNRNGNVKFYGKKNFSNMHDLVLEDLFEYIDSINTYFQNHKNEVQKYTIEADFCKSENINSDVTSKKIPWDKYETALLIETFWQVEEKKVDRQTAINNLSMALRKKAINQGLKIDDKFRNTNGISIQIGNIALSFFPERSPLHRTAIFDEVATIYKMDKEEFDRILNRAHSLVCDHVELDHNRNIQELETEEIDKITPSNKSFFNNDVSDYLTVIKTCFPDGYSYNNPLKKKRFIREYPEINNKEFSDSDNIYLEKIQEVGFVSEEKVYLPDIVSEETKSSIQNYIDSNFECGNLIIYYSVIHSQFRDKLNSNFSEDMMIHYLKYVFNDMYNFNELFVSKKGNDVNLKKLLIDIFVNCGCPLDIEEIYEKLPNISHEAIDQVVKDKDFVVNKKGKSYFYRDTFIIEIEELDEIKKYIQKSILENGSASGLKIYDFIQCNLPNLINSNPGMTNLGYKNILKIMLDNEFNFNGDVISARGENIDVNKLFTDFCKFRERFSLSDLNEFKDSINKSNISWDVVFQSAVRIDKNDFVRRDLINFDVIKIDAAINSYCKNDYISFNEVINFIDFPTIGFTWNYYILESYLFANSTNFRLIHSSFNMDEPVGGIVKVNSNITNFDELIIQILKDNKLFEQDKAYDYLLENGFIKRRRISNIDLLIEKARLEV